MNSTPHIRKNLLVFLKESKVNIIAFIILPMVLAFIYGIMQADIFEGKYQETKSFKVHFVYDKASMNGKILTEILNEESVRKIIVEDEKTKDFVVNISDNFKKVSIKAKSNDNLQAEILKSFMSTFLDNTKQYEKVANIIQKSSIDEEKSQDIMSQIMATMDRLNKQTSIQGKIVEGYKMLGAREYFAISMFSFSMILMIQVLAKSFYRDKENGIIRRVFTTTCEKGDYFVGFIISNFIKTAIITIIYILLNRGLKIAFLGSAAGLFLIILSMSLFISAISGLIIAFFKEEKSANIFMSVLIALPIVIGGVFIPNDFIDIRFLQYIARVAPNTLIVNTFKDFAISGSISSISFELIISLLLSAVILILSYSKINVKWEV